MMDWLEEAKSSYHTATEFEGEAAQLHQADARTAATIALVERLDKIIDILSSTDKSHRGVLQYIVSRDGDMAYRWLKAAADTANQMVEDDERRP